MGLTLTKQAPKRRYIPIRLTAQVLCECGKPATRQVWFTQINSGGKTVLGMLPVCDDCCKLMLEIDNGIVEVR